MKTKQPIVLIGGMGPQASVTAYRMLIEKAVSQHGATDNEDFPHIIVQSLSVPDFISSQDRQAEAIAIMRRATKLAAIHDPSVVGMSCNTAHLFAPQMLGGIDLPFVSLIDIVADKVLDAGIMKVGLLASPTTIKTNLYDVALDKRSIDVLHPSQAQQQKLETIIRAVIGGSAGGVEAESLNEIALDLQVRGAEAVILGCTELPLIFPKQSSVEAFDCLELLTDRLLEEYFKSNPIRKESI